MIDSLHISQIYVLDQDKALDFYCGVLGLEKNTDQDLGFMRFLTVNVPGHPDRQILLERPALGASTGLFLPIVRSDLLFFTTRDARKAYDELKQKGIDFSQELTEQEYGTDFGLRDPFGNHIRIAQLKQAPVATKA